MTANKFTDTQLVLLSAAAQHPEGAIQLASDLKGGTAKKAVGKLLREGLIEEVPARDALPVWRHDDDQGSLALRITRHGLAAIGVEAGVADRKAEKPHEPQKGGDRAPKRPSRRVEAASRKKNKDEAPAGIAKVGCTGFEAGPRDRNAPTPTGRDHHGHHESDRLAAALGSRLLCRRGAQEARPDAGVREDRHRAGLLDRGQKYPAQKQVEPKGRVIRMSR